MSVKQLIARATFEGMKVLEREQQELKARKEEQNRRAREMASMTGFDPWMWKTPGSRRSWPFKDMYVGEIETFDASEAKAARSAAHTYGAKAGMKFETRLVDGVLYIKRIV